MPHPIRWLAAGGLLLSACNTSVQSAPTERGEAVGEPAPAAYAEIRTIDIAASTIAVSEALCGCGDPEERYLFAISRPGGPDELVALVHSARLTRIAHDLDNILPGQTLWYLERRRGDTVGPLVYFNFEPTYDEAETMVVSYVSGDDRFASVLRGGWLREHDTDPRPDPLEWSIVYGTFQAARAAERSE